MTQKQLKKTLEIIGKQISDKRKELKLTHKVVADACKMTRKTLIALEKGHNPVVLNYLITVCHYLGIESVELKEVKK